MRRVCVALKTFYTPHREGLAPRGTPCVRSSSQIKKNPPINLTYPSTTSNLTHRFVFELIGGPRGTRTPEAVRHRVYSAAELPLSDRPTRDDRKERRMNDDRVTRLVVVRRGGRRQVDPRAAILGQKSLVFNRQKALICLILSHPTAIWASLLSTNKWRSVR